MHVGKDEMPARSEDASELRDHRCQVRYVRQRETAEHDVLRTVIDRKFMQVSNESRVGLGMAEHLRRTVDGDHVVTALDQQPGEPPRAAGSIKRPTRRNRVKDRRDVRLVSERSVLAGVIRGSPASVSVSRRELGYLNAVGQVLVSQQRANLGQPRFDKLAIVLAGERAEQRRSFDPDEVSERMLVTHACGR